MNRDLRLFLLLARFIATVLALPDLRDNSQDPISVFVGEEVLLPCTVKDLEDNSVIWKRVKFGKAEILTAGTVRVTSDSRVSVLHTEGGDEWVLSISTARGLDTAQYVCEVNSSPSVRIFLHLQVVTPSPPPHAMPFSIGHNYTDCCLQKRVPDKCLGYCSLSNIILGRTGVPALECQDHLNSIAFCMADGRNHEPCCIREDIPETCREVCRGKYTLQSASVFHHYTCSYYSQATLACIAQGIEILPGPPREVAVEALSDSEVSITWLAPADNGDSIIQYIVNVTELKAFDELEQVGDEDLAELSSVEEEEYFPADGTMPPLEAKVERQGRQQSSADKFREHKVDGNTTSLTIDNLKPYSMYEVEVIAVNIHGSSLPSYRVRTLTLIPTSDEESEKKANGNSSNVEIPDVRACCIREGLPMQSCLHRFCDPARADEIGLTDLMICAPWVGITVPCLTQRRDLTPCCRQRGLPDLCVNLCHSNISRIDFQYFQCLPHMSVYANCLMDSYGVLPSPPKSLVVNNVNPTWAILHWQPPEKLAETVIAYDVHVRDTNNEYIVIVNNTKSPFLLDSLTPDSKYEAYVTAFNEYGSSASSGRLLFRTGPLESVDDGEDATDEVDGDLDEDTLTHSLYNVSDCCSHAGVNSSCLAVCDYRTKMHQVQNVLPGCLADFHKILKCGVGGRNHVPCCRRRDVQSSCLDLCAGVVKQPVNVLAAVCVIDLISIVECLEEGTRTLPGPVHSFHVLNLNTTTAFLQWTPPVDGEVLSYDVTYTKDSGPSQGKPKQFMKITVNSTDTSTIIDNLEPNQAYLFYVMAANEYGWSLPSSEARINMTAESEGDSTSGVPSGPIGLAVTEKNTTFMEVRWLPPEFSHPTDQLKFKLYYMEGNDTIPHTVTTSSLGLRLVNLNPNTKYTMYVTAMSGKDFQESRNEETLIAYTDPAYPAFVEAPHIHPSTQIIEGGNMTVLCVAMGSPVPTVSVFVNGKLYNQEMKSHLVTNIVNVTRDMSVVACFAENGYGDGMQTTKRIQISYGPSIIAGDAAQVTTGETATVDCFVQGYPEPKLEFWRDVDGSRQKAQGQRFRTRTMQNGPDKYSMQLSLFNTTMRDQGNYICQAVNPLGHTMQAVAIHVQLPPTARENSVKDCCISQHVAPECMDACSFDIDIDAISQRFQCISEMHKLMFCASDGGDHRRCCLGWGVPRRCLGWCHGQTIKHGAMCVAEFGRQIVSCFQEGKDLLPGPPQDLSVVTINDHTLQLTWDSPVKNPGMVQFYRVTWRKTGSGRSIKFHNDTRAQQITIPNLVPGESYEIGVKAINHHGSSAISDVLQYANQGIVGRLEDVEGSSTGLIIGIVILIVVVLVAVFLGVLYYRKHYMYRSSGGVSFENPSYMRDGTSDTIQIAHAQETNGGFHIEAHKGDTTDTPSVGGFYEELSANSSNNKPNNNKDVF